MLLPSLSGFVSPRIHNRINVSVFVSHAQPLVFVKAPGLTHCHYCRFPSHTLMMNPSRSHLCHLTVLWAWFMSPADGWTKGHSLLQRGDRGGGEGGRTSGEHYCGENAERGNFLMLSPFGNFSETDKWQACAAITGHTSCNACFQAHTQTCCSGFTFLQTDSDFIGVSRHRLVVYIL